MENKDTAMLLKECDAGVKMATSSLNDLLDKVKDPKLYKLLTKSRDHHEKLGNEIHSLLDLHDETQKEPDPFIKSMSWIKTNVKMGLDNSDATIANLITDGCNMGIKSLQKDLNEYAMADEISKKIAQKLMTIEDQLRNDLSSYL